MAFSAFSIASSRVLPNPDISIPETFAAHFQRRRSMPCTTEYSIPLNCIVIAFVCLRESGCNVHQPPRLAGVVNTDSGGDLFS
jgi:hypothetical protein